MKGKTSSIKATMRPRAWFGLTAWLQSFLSSFSRNHRRADGLTDRPTDWPSYRDSSILKTSLLFTSWICPWRLCGITWRRVAVAGKARAEYLERLSTAIQARLPAIQARLPAVFRQSRRLEIWTRSLLPSWIYYISGLLMVRPTIHSWIIFPTFIHFSSFFFLLIHSSKVPIATSHGFNDM